MTHNAKAKLLTGSGLLKVLTLLVCVVSVVGFLAKVWWVFEMMCHFRLHFMVVLGFFSVLWLLLRHCRWAAACGALALVNALIVFSLLIPSRGAPASSGATVRFVSLNVHTANQHTDLVLKFLRESDADVIFLMEVNDRWMAELSSLKDIYPMSVADPPEDNFGIALFSRLPLAKTNIIQLGRAYIPSVTAQIECGGRKVFLLGTHPFAPGNAYYARTRNSQLADVGGLVRQQSLTVVVIGDLNETPWSPYFTDLLKESGLRNSSQGLGFFNSWPAALRGFGIPLDHCLVSSEFSVVKKKLGPQVGSDHLPVIIDLQLAGDK